MNKPQPAPKKVRKRKRNSTDWKIGEVYVYHTRSKNYFMRVTSYHEDKGGICPNVVLLDWPKANLPSKFALCFLGIRNVNEQWGGNLSGFMLFGEPPAHSVRKLDAYSFWLYAKQARRAHNFVADWSRFDEMLQKIID